MGITKSLKGYMTFSNTGTKADKESNQTEHSFIEGTDHACKP